MTSTFEMVQELRHLRESRAWRKRGLAVLIERVIQHRRTMAWLAAVRDQEDPEFAT